MTAKAYAKGTTVPVSRSKSAIEDLLRKHGATMLLVGEDLRSGRAFVAFRIAERNVRMDVPLPLATDRSITHRRASGAKLVERTESDKRAAYERSCRERWRVVWLVTKAKLEAIALGHSSVEREFLYDIQLANGQTLGKMLESGRLDRTLGVASSAPLLPPPQREAGS